jgi:hypothetical protein
VSPGSGTVGLAHVKGAWDATVVEVNKRSKRVGAFLNPSRPVQMEGDHLVVEVQSKFHAREMNADSNRQLFTDSLHAALGIRPEVAFAARGESPEDAVAHVDPSSDAMVSPATPAGGDFVDEPVTDVEEDPVELVKQGFAAQIVEEKKS